MTRAAPERRQHARVLAHLFGMIGLAAAVLGTSGQVLAANRLFHALAPGIVRHVRGRLRLTDEVADRLVGEAFSLRRAHSRGDSVHCFPIRWGDGASPAIGHLIALQGSARDTLSGASGILLIAPLQPRPEPDRLLLQRLFDLSPAEARVASGIVAGRTIQAIAEDFSVSRETVRSQLKTVLAKTGSKRQLDLAVLLAALSFPSAQS